MELSVRTRLTRLACGLLVPLAVAGTCLAAPQAALAEGGSPLQNVAAASADSAATETTDTVAADAATDEASAEYTTLVLGRLQVDVPSDWDTFDLGQIIVASAEDESCTVTLATMTVEDLVDDPVPSDATEQQAYFDTAAQNIIAAYGGTLAGSATGSAADLGASDLADATLYAYEVVPTDAGDGVYILVAYLVYADGSVDVVEVSSAQDDEVFQTVADSANVVASAEDAVSATEAATVELPQTVEVGGITLGLPDYMVEEVVDGSSERDFYNEDQTFFVSAMPDIFEGEDASDLDDETYELMAQMIVEGLDGELLASASIENDGLRTLLYAFAIADDSEVSGFGSLGFTLLPDGTVSCVLGLCSPEASEEFGSVMDAVYASIALA